jgi:hypothetical protein
MMKIEMLLFQKKPYNSWILNEDTCLWNAPVALPDTENKYTWNETNLNWDLTTL